jgi:hypothetical protein
MNTIICNPCAEEKRDLSELYNGGESRKVGINIFLALAPSLARSSNMPLSMGRCRHRRCALLRSLFAESRETTWFGLDGYRFRVPAAIFSLFVGGPEGLTLFFFNFSPSMQGGWVSK